MRAPNVPRCIGLSDPERTLTRSQHGPLASAVLTAVPTSRMTRIEAQHFRLLLLRRLRLPLPLTSRTCRCGRLLDSFGHHRAACSGAGVLGGERVPIGAGRGTGVQRSRGESKDQHVHPRHGSRRGQHSRREKTRSRRGWIVVVNSPSTPLSCHHCVEMGRPGGQRQTATG